MVNIIKGAMDELLSANRTQPDRQTLALSSMEAQQNPHPHQQNERRAARLTTKSKLPPTLMTTTFVRPILFELNKSERVATRSVWSCTARCPLPRQRIDQLIDQINAKGYALASGAMPAVSKALLTISATASKLVTSTLTATSLVRCRRHNLAVTACPVPVQQAVHSPATPGLYS